MTFLLGRFWSHVDKSGDCWTWTGSTFASGYGRACVDSRIVRAHRVAWEVTNGPIPKGMWVLHRCDNPPCVRPDHLFLGDRSDNMVDASQKGRLATIKLDPIRVRAIRAEYADGVPLRALARTYGVDRSNIQQIVKRKTWRHVA